MQISGLVWDEIISLIKSDRIHTAETANGKIYICTVEISDDAAGTTAMLPVHLDYASFYKTETRL